MLIKNDFYYQSVIRQFLGTLEWQNPYAVTLTLKQGIGPKLYLTDDIADGTIRHFLKKLDRVFFSTIQTRKGIGVQAIVVMEEGFQGDRKHYHLMIDCPDDRPLDEMHKTIIECWRGLLWAYYEVDVQKADSGWIRYITKMETKPNFQEAIKWQLCRISPSN